MIRNVLAPRCNVLGCSSGGDELLRCGACKITRYCGKGHQTDDRPSHKHACTRIRRSRQKHEKEEKDLRNSPGDFMSPADPFENSVGHFWGILSTRDYMRARIDYVLSMLKINTHDAVESSLDHLLDMLRLCRSDNLGVRDIVPGLFLRLNRDQECYDFVKWWAGVRADGSYDYGDTDLLYCNLKDEDVMENVDVFCVGWGQAHSVPVTLIKVRMLLDLRDLLNSSLLHGVDKLNYDAVRAIQNTLTFRSGIWTARSELLSRDGLEARIKQVEQQLDEIFESVNEDNKFFWKGLLDADRYLDMTPSAYSMGSWEEMILLVHNNAMAWRETDGALEWLRVRVK